MKAVYTRYFLFVLICLMTTFTPVPAHAKTCKRIHSTTTTIMVGDSYSTRPKGYPESFRWPQRLRKILHLKDSQVCFRCKWGYGFARDGRQFIDLLKPLKASRKVKAVIIVGGVTNDLKSGKGKKEIRKGFKKVNSLIRKRFPNATIYYAAVSWRTEETWQRQIRIRRAWYRDLCRRYGWEYMASCENVFENAEDWSEEDGHHPNKHGVDLLVAALSSYFI